MFFQIGNYIFQHFVYSKGVKKEAPPEFPKWLRTRLDEQNLSLRDAAQRIGVTHPTLSDAIGGKQPSFETCLRLARYFKHSPCNLFEIAGLIPKLAIDESESEELLSLFERLSPSDRAEVIDFMRFKAGASRTELPLYDIMLKASKKPLGMVFTNYRLDELESMFEADRYRIIEHGYVRGQGHVYEVIDLDEGRVGVGEDDK